MKKINIKEKNQPDFQDLEHTFRLKGSITPKREISETTNILENLGFTTSMNSIVKNLEQDGTVKVLSPFSGVRNADTLETPTKFGAISNQTLKQLPLDPSVKRIRFISNTLLKLLLLAIIINFILIFVL